MPKLEELHVYIIQVSMCMRGVYVLNEGAWPNACLRDRSCYCTLLSSKRRLLSEGHEIECEHSDLN